MIKREIYEGVAIDNCIELNYNKAEKEEDALHQISVWVMASRFGSHHQSEMVNESQIEEKFKEMNDLVKAMIDSNVNKRRGICGILKKIGFDV